MPNNWPGEPGVPENTESTDIPFDKWCRATNPPRAETHDFARGFNTAFAEIPAAQPAAPDLVEAAKAVVSEWNASDNFLGQISDTAIRILGNVIAKIPEEGLFIPQIDGTMRHIPGRSAQPPAQKPEVTDEMVSAAGIAWNEYHGDDQRIATRMRIALEAALRSQPPAQKPEVTEGMLNRAEAAIHEHKTNLSMTMRERLRVILEEALRATIAQQAAEIDRITKERDDARLDKAALAGALQSAEAELKAAYEMHGGAARERDTAQAALAAEQRAHAEFEHSMGTHVEDLNKRILQLTGALATARRDGIVKAAEHLLYNFDVLPPYEGVFKNVQDEELALNAKSQCIDELRALANKETPNDPAE